MQQLQVVSILLLFAGSGVSQSKPGNAAVSSRWLQIETFKYRPGQSSGVERTFILESPATPDMEQSFTRLRIQIPASRNLWS